MLISGRTDPALYVSASNLGSIFGEYFVRIAVQPAFPWLSRSNNRMTAGPCMFTGVLIQRAVATKRYPACLTRPQMHPIAADLYAFFAFPAFRLHDGFDCIQMGTASGTHDELAG
jgi:hypothetical protein